MSSNYAVISFTNPRGLPVPVGVALWSPVTGFGDFRVIDAEERLNNLRLGPERELLRFATRKLKAWREGGALPYAAAKEAAEFRPHQTEWWSHARRLLIHRLQLTEPRPIDCEPSTTGLDSLFEQVLAPYRPEKDVTLRVDRRVTDCLGELADYFDKNARLVGGNGSEVRVTRAYKGPAGWVVIEALNLTGHAVQAADEVLGKLTRLRLGTSNVSLIVGYLPSPHGLNGEAKLVELIREQCRASTFDLVKESHLLHTTAYALFDSANGQELLGRERLAQLTTKLASIRSPEIKRLKRGKLPAK